MITNFFMPGDLVAMRDDYKKEQYLGLVVRAYVARGLCWAWVQTYDRGLIHRIERKLGLVQRDHCV